MKTLIASTKSSLPLLKSFEFHLREVGVETKIVDIQKYFSLYDFKILKAIPLPRAAKIVKSFDPDIIFTDEPIFTSSFKQVLKRPLILWLKGDPWQEMEWKWKRYTVKHNPWNRFKWEFYVKRYFFGLGKADMIFAVSDWLQRKVKQRTRNIETKTFRYIGDLRDWIEERYSPLQTSMQVLSVFPFEIIPKICGWVKFLKVAKNMKDVTFHVAGGGPYLNWVKSKSPNNVNYLGHVSRETVKKFLLEAMVFVYPSGLDMHPRALVEALVMSRPSVVSNVCGIPEMVENRKSGFVCALDDKDCWEEKVRILLTDENLRKRFGYEGRKRMLSMFEPHKVVKQFVSEIEKSLI